MAFRNPDGADDLIGSEAAFWHHFKQTAFNVFACYGYTPIETPFFENTELFVRGIGQATDVVSKEMFHAISGQNLARLLAGDAIKAKSRLSLRPEGTAGVVRAVVQHDLVPQGAAPVKLMYAGPMFRAERPQHNRKRQFNQVGVECLGAETPSVDAEAIIMLMRFYQRIGIDASWVKLRINSMGCDSCRPAYREQVKSFLAAHQNELCDDCRLRMEVNPLRVFDCKQPGCQALMADAPLITNHLCESCASHHAEVKSYLDAADIAYVEDPTLVRGLDYYTRTVFEVTDVSEAGAQDAIGGGGRYDKLAEEIGGRSIAGLGFALGFERCRNLLVKKGLELGEARTCQVFFACVDAAYKPQVFTLLQQCRDAGIAAEMDHQNRSLKSQFKLAHKLQAEKVAVLGPDEVSQGALTLRDMNSHEEQTVPFGTLLDTLTE